jgi:hypothetical protein
VDEQVCEIEDVYSENEDEVGCGAIEYKPNRENKSEMDEDIGDYEKLSYGHDYIELDDGSHVTIWKYSMAKVGGIFA